MKQYILHHPKGTVVATYTSTGKLKRLEAKKGVLHDAAKAGHDFAYLEPDIDLALWTPLKPAKDPFFIAAQWAWLDFFKKRAGFAYFFTATDGGAIKTIGKALVKMNGDTQKALEVWKYLLQNWDTLPDFYRNKPEPKFIASQLNTILNLLKNGKQTSGATTATYADDYRQGI